MAFAINLLGGANTEASNQRHRRTPSLPCMLKEEGRNRSRKEIPSAAVEMAESESEQQVSCRISLEHSFDVPFSIQLLEASI
jgi:hypothetical protein